MKAKPRWLANSRSVLESGSPLSPSPGAHSVADQRTRVLAPVLRSSLATEGGQSKIGSVYFCFLLSALCFTAHAQYSIPWHTIEGGGGTSTGSVYSVSGTIGQPDASTTPMTNGQYSVTGGFWSLFAVQTLGAPTLTIIPAGPGQATISWTPVTPGFVLQETLSLSPFNWTNSLSGATNPVVVPATPPARYYRLHKP